MSAPTEAAGWREQIRALTGGDDLGAMTTWLMANGWTWGVDYTQIHVDTWGIEAWVRKIDDLAGGDTQYETLDPAEALATALLRALDDWSARATEGR